MGIVIFPSWFLTLIIALIYPSFATVSCVIAATAIAIASVTLDGQ